MKNLRDRYRQALLLAAQMRTRKQMGDRYAHAKRWHLSRPETRDRRLVSEQLESV